MANALQIVDSLISKINTQSTATMQLPRRIVRFYSCSDESKSEYDDSTAYYGILEDNQQAKVGTIVSLFDYNDIYDTSSYKANKNKKEIKKLLPPINATNIFCIGLNYKFHASESKMSLPKYPVIFTKPTTAIVGCNDNIIIPKCCIKGTDNDNPGECDYEVELVVIIGKKCKNVSENDALKYIFGYSIANDVSARKWQLDKDKSGTQWIRGKSFDTFCPFGPCILMEDNKNINAQNLNLYTNLNGKTVQNSNTKEMIFPIRKLVSFLSESTTLLPGTIILSGTPDGVGFVRKPPIWLKNGDNVIVSVEGIGDLINNVKDE
eukprot:85855_1